MEYRAVAMGDFTELNSTPEAIANSLTMRLNGMVEDGWTLAHVVPRYPTTQSVDAGLGSIPVPTNRGPFFIFTK